MTHKETFSTLRTEGALLPPDLLQRLAANQLDGLSPQHYHLLEGEKMNEVINRAWTRLLGAWQAFRKAQDSPSVKTLTRDKWLLPLFDTLGYGRLNALHPVPEIEGRSYPISHFWGNTPIHLVSFHQDLDKRIGGSLSPYSLLQTFLNRSERHLWGIVTNGYKLRILRDNLTLTRQAYLEFDLFSMFEGEVYGDFVLFWLICHASRFQTQPDAPQPWLERWMRYAEQQGTRALDQLRSGVENAISELGAGFLEHPANTRLRTAFENNQLSPQDYYRYLLRLIYRLLFLFVAEDRNLLLSPNAPPQARETYQAFYSTTRLRHLATKIKGTAHHDLFEGLRLIMSLLSGERTEPSPQTLLNTLGLVPLGSFLFRQQADPLPLQQACLSNARFLEALRHLAYTYDSDTKSFRKIDYKNLGAEELGSVYESLLEQRPYFNLSARTFKLQSVSGNERKTTGSYYTPRPLVDALLASTLSPVLDRAAAHGPEALLALKICDPACGSGHFLIAAAQRLALRLAILRTGDDHPALADLQQAKRDVISHCIYGVDLNPMAVELCKVNLWMEALEPGKPLTFLDHRILVGNSLLGATPHLMAQGIPDEAFNPIEGDDKKAAADAKKQNKKERAERRGDVRQLDLFGPAYQQVSASYQALNAAPDETLEDIRRIEAAYQRLANDPTYLQARLLADAWCAAFVWETDVKPPLTDRFYRHLQAEPSAPFFEAHRQVIVRLADRYHFFHWHLAFPNVFPLDPHAPHGWQCGFDVVLGNPPWERIKIQEKEWFAQRDYTIATAPNAAQRDKRIQQLATDNPALLEAFHADKRKAEGESHFVRHSQRFPLTGRGDVNTYPLFAELGRHLIQGAGRLGLIVPSGIATDDTTKFFFQDIIQSHSLASLYDFENRDGLFPGVHRSYKFSLLTLTGADDPQPQADFIFFAHGVDDLEAEGRRFSLAAEDIARLNPNTKTMATFRTVRDAALTLAIYRRVPILLREGEPEEGNPWGISFLSMFHMSNDSGLFHTAEEMERKGYVPRGNRYVRGASVYLPLYEAKLMHQFTHRWATYESEGNIHDFELKKLRQPKALVIPRYWVAQEEVEARTGSWPYAWLLASRDICRTTDERTAIFGLLPRVAVGNKAPLIFANHLPEQTPALLANANAIVFDYVARQKVGGTNLSFFILKQLPVLPPWVYNAALLGFIVPRVLELTYTACDMAAFAQDMGYSGPPFVWDEGRRFALRCELDALYFHLYHIAREDVAYIMDTFPIVQRKDEEDYGRYRTKEAILSLYDELASLPTMDVPDPQSGEVSYAVPDVRQWQSVLQPPPADPSVSHAQGACGPEGDEA